MSYLKDRMICVYCRTRIPANVHFCPNCGAPVDTKKPVPRHGPGLPLGSRMVSHPLQKEYYTDALVTAMVGIFTCWVPVLGSALSLFSLIMISGYIAANRRGNIKTNAVDWLTLVLAAAGLAGGIILTVLLIVNRTRMD